MKRYNKKVYKKISNKRRLYFVILFSLILSIGLGYAYLQSVLTFSGTTKISKNNWDIHFENLTSTDNTKVSITNDTTVTLNVTLNPGDSFEYTVDAVNNGSIDAKIGSITPITVPSAYQNVIEYSLNYEYPGENEVISVNDVLRSGKKEPIKFTIRYKGEDELDSDVEGATLNLNFTISYVQADSNITEVEHIYRYPDNKVCMKAKNLHTEECSRTDSRGCIANGYSQGATITYGHTDSTKLDNGTLKNGVSQGYALDCDVNGNGVVDTDTNGNSTERFYYVSDFYDTNLSTPAFNSNYATLIYYDNVGASAYHGTSSSYNNYSGPSALLSSLPTSGSSGTWKNVSLLNTQRQIRNERGGTTSGNGSYTLPKFSYTGRAARLLTVQEVNSACNITVGSQTKGELDSCEFLMEDTAYSKTSGCTGSCIYWLETPYAAGSIGVWYVTGGNRDVMGTVAYITNGSRPAVDILKSDISLK